MSKNYKRIVVKIGTNVLTCENGKLDFSVIEGLVEQISDLKLKQNIEVLLVSSGAVGAGMSIISNIDKRDENIIQRQIYSSIGQIRLMNTYSNYFSQFGLFCAQVLVTKEDFRDHQHFMNITNCLSGLLHDKIIPIINENDVVSVTELMFTDNDELAGLISEIISPDALILLTTVDGLLNGHPDDPHSKVISKVKFGDNSISQYLFLSKSLLGRGGMHSKVKVAQKTTEFGIDVYIANGKKENILNNIISGNYIGTKFNRDPK